MTRRLFAVALLACSLLAYGAPIHAYQQPSAQQQPADPNDPIERIKDEGMNRSQVMQTLSYLTDVIGPRLTGSTNLKRANEWTRDKMTEWGLQNAHLEAWGPFGRGWALKDFSCDVVSPQMIPLIAFPKAWSPSIKGVLAAEPVFVEAKDENDLQKYKGQLKDRIVLSAPMREVKAHFEAQGTRRDEKDLLRLADAPEPGSRQGQRFQMQQMNNPQFQERMRNAVFDAKKLAFFQEEGVAVLIEPGRGDGGTIFVQGATVAQKIDTSSPQASMMSLMNGRVRPQDKDAQIVPQIVVAVEHYNRLVRMIQAGEKPKVRVKLETEYQEQDPMAYNTIAEIPGTDKKDEIVMLGAHIDSWHSGTGATDNGAGCAVVMEAVRILQALKLQPRRTIRIGLWSGEEQGLYGSRAYVAQHFGKPEESEANAMTRMIGGGGDAPKIVYGPEYDKLSGYFNLDNGTGRIRGVYLQGNEGVRSIFRDWLAPFRGMEATTLTIANTGGTDHLAFDAIGLPGFQFIQDDIEYDTRTHHSNMDVFDRIQAGDMKQAAIVMAAFVYNTAMRDEKLPRKPMKQPESAKK